MADGRLVQRILRRFQNLEEEIGAFDSIATVEYVNATIELVDEIWLEYLKVEKDVKGKFSADAETDVQTIEKKYAKSKGILHLRRKLLEKNQPKTEVEDSSTLGILTKQQEFLERLVSLQSKDGDIKPPRAEIPHFYGNYAEFPMFKDLFEQLVHNKETIPKVQKLQLLKSYLRGDAAKILSHTPITEANYEPSWKKICSRFHKRRNLVTSLIGQFMELPVLRQPSVKGLRSLYDVTGEVLSGLDVLGPETQKPDPWVIYLLMEKFDKDTKEAWALEVVDTDFPTIDMCLKFLEKRCEAMETILPVTAKQIRTPKVMMVQQIPTEQVLACAKCSGNHRLTDCAEFLALDVKDRKKFVVNRKLCFNCILHKHPVHLC